MKILIENGGYQIKNIGDSAMLKVAIQRLDRLFPGAEIAVFTSDAYRLNLLKHNCHPILNSGQHIWFSPYLAFIHNLFPKTNKYHISDVEWHLRRKYPNLFFSSFKYKDKLFKRNSSDLEEFIESVRSSDLIVSSGGGYITDSFKHKAIATLGILALAQSFKKSTVMLGHGLGPLNQDILSSKARIVFPEVKLITLREGLESPNLLKKMGVKPEKIQVTGDDAIELAFNQKNGESEEGLGINIRFASYSKLNEGVIKEIRSALQEFAYKKEVPLVPIPIDFDPHTSDVQSIKKITQGYPSVIEMPEDVLQPEDVAKQAGLCRVVVTGSYHAGVFALSQGIPVIGLSKSAYYQIKFSGLAQQFRSGVTVIDLSKPDFKIKLEQSLEEYWAKSDLLRDQLLLSAQEQINLSVEAYQGIQNIL